MRSYRLKTLQETKSGFTHLYIVEQGDFVKNATTALTLTALSEGDVVMRVLQERKTAFANGGTGTMSVGLSDAVTQFTAATDMTSSGAMCVAAVASVTPYPTPSGGKTLVANTVISNNTVTAGEIWIWVNISRVEDRGANAGYIDA